MPRLENSDGTILMYFALAFDPDDPGATPPVDVCNSCYCSWDAELEIDHPEYDDGYYTCLDCGKVLTSEDN